MSVSDNFNLGSRAYMASAGLLGLTAAFLSVSQGNGHNGMGQALFYGHALLCSMLGGGLLAVSLSGWRNVQQQLQRPIMNYTSAPAAAYRVVAPLNREQEIRIQRHGRLTEGGTALVFSALASQMPAGSGGELLAVILAGYGAGSMIGATWNTAQLKWLKRKPSAVP